MAIIVPTEHSVTHRQFLDAQTSIEVLIGGQSDVKAALAPQMIHRAAFNYADTGESPIESYFKMKRHLDDLTHLRVFIYSLALPSFVGVRTERLYPRMYRRGQIGRADYADLRALGVRSPAWERFAARFKVTGKSELYLMRQNLARRLSGRAPLPPKKGAIMHGFRYSLGSKVDAIQAADLIDHHFQGDPLDATLIDYFHRLLRLVKDRGVTIVTVSPPVTDLYLKGASKYVTVDELRAATVDDERFAGLIDHHIDMTDLFADRHDLFRDQNHMNAAGAEAASRHLASMLSHLVDPAVDRLDPPPELRMSA